VAAPRFVGEALAGMQRRASPLPITMWEFSWLVRRTGGEAEYADWDRVLGELIDRGYGCVRIDAFPHLVASGPRGDARERFTIRPQPKQFMWGNHAPVEVSPRRGLVEFLSRLADRKLRVGLSSWFVDDDSHRRVAIASATDLSRVWIETLAFLESEGFLGLVEWVDLCNEFPLPMWLPAVSRDIFGARLTGLRVMFSRWTPEQRTAAGRFACDAIGAVRARFPRLAYTLSLTSWNAQSVFRTDLSAFDLLEPHLWISDAVAWNAITGHPLMLLLPFARQQAAVYARLAEAAWRRDPDGWLRGLGESMDRWTAFARERGLPLYTTEGWASVMYDDVASAPGASEWGWFKEASEEAVRMAASRGWQGICTSNFAQPHFRGMWSDAAWHRRVNALVRGAGAATGAPATASSGPPRPPVP